MAASGMSEKSELTDRSDAVKGMLMMMNLTPQRIKDPLPSGHSGKTKSPRQQSCIASNTRRSQVKRGNKKKEKRRERKKRRKKEPLSGWRTLPPGIEPGSRA